MIVEEANARMEASQRRLNNRKRNIAQTSCVFARAAHRGGPGPWMQMGQLIC